MLKFSLVTTCRNEISSLPRWKENILGQTRQPDEIVVIDAFSDDGTAEMLFNWAHEDSRVIVKQEKGAAAHGRNVAIEMALHEHILSTDMGVRLCHAWCEELIKPFEEDISVEVVAGNTRIDKDTVKSAAARAEYYIENGGESKLGPGFVPGNRSMAYIKKVWRGLGGLPEDLTFYADDSVFGRQIIQAGYKMAYAPRAMTYWARPSRLRDFWREQYVYGIGHGEADIKVPMAFRWHLKGILPAFLVPPLTALRFFQKQLCLTALLRAIRHLDVLALVYIPLLSLGNGYHLAKGHIVGYCQGTQKCQECRKRLKHPVLF
jgi:cellulose synthase/poly-beta-1,6-N-acetylglucosamine synthase-like glycosyltransferase